jgi:hypothetical protein
MVQKSSLFFCGGIMTEMCIFYEKIMKEVLTFGADKGSPSNIMHSIFAYGFMA